MKKLNKLLYILISIFLIVSFNIALTFILSIFVNAPYTSYHFQQLGPELGEDLKPIKSVANAKYFRDRKYFYDLLYKYTAAYQENVFLVPLTNRYMTYYIGDSQHLDKFISAKNEDFTHNEPAIYIRENSVVEDLYTDDYELHVYPDVFELAGKFNTSNKYAYLFTERTQTYILEELKQFHEFGNYGTAQIPNKFASKLAKEIQAIQASQESDLLDTYIFSWNSFGTQDTLSFIKDNFSSFENISYIVLTLSLLLSYLYITVYYFHKLRYRLKVNTYFGLSKEANHIQMYMQQALIFLLSSGVTLIITYAYPMYSRVTWQEVYLKIYLIIIFILSLVIPLIMVRRNTKWLENMRGGT